MLITGDKKEGFNVHFNKTDMKASIELGGNIMVTLSADKADELKARLEEILPEEKE